MPVSKPNYERPAIVKRATGQIGPGSYFLSDPWKEINSKQSQLERLRVQIRDARPKHDNPLLANNQRASLVPSSSEAFLKTKNDTIFEMSREASRNEESRNTFLNKSKSVPFTKEIRIHSNFMPG